MYRRPDHALLTQGNLDIVELMFQRQPDNIALAVSAIDVVGMTPLHKAALFDRISIVKLLLEQVKFGTIQIQYESLEIAQLSLCILISL